ncbi:16453_t:CDS:1, partial [Gigaspora margarita]
VEVKRKEHEASTIYQQSSKIGGANRTCKENKTHKNIEMNHLAKMFEPSFEKDMEIRKEIPIDH